MLESVRVVHQLVWDLKSVERYFASAFKLTPVDRHTPPYPASWSISYQVGESRLVFSQPGHSHSEEFDNLRRFGRPVITHVTFGVEDLARRADELRAAGVVFVEEDPITYLDSATDKALDIEPERSAGARVESEKFSLPHMLPESSHGIRLRLCENRP